MLQTSSFADIGRLEQIASMILNRYVEQYYTQARRVWEQDQMAYQELSEEDDNLIGAYEAQVKRSATEFLHTLYEMCEDPALYQGEAGLPDRVHFDRHLYLPLLLDDPAEDPVVKYAPPGLNRGELDFVRQLRAYLQTEEGQSLLHRHDRELYLLRNQSRGRGVGFLVDNERFFPDFILWLKGREQQDIVFIDPHGLITGGNLDVNAKVQFHQTIKEYERKLNERAHREDVALHSFLISQTSFSELRNQTGILSYPEFHQRHIYFGDQDNHVDLMLRAILSTSPC